MGQFVCRYKRPYWLPVTSSLGSNDLHHFLMSKHRTSWYKSKVYRGYKILSVDCIQMSACLKTEVQYRPNPLTMWLGLRPGSRAVFPTLISSADGVKKLALSVVLLEPSSFAHLYLSTQVCNYCENSYRPTSVYMRPTPLSSPPSLSLSLFVNHINVPVTKQCFYRL